MGDEKRKELKENLKKRIDEMSDEELDKVAGGMIIEGFNSKGEYIYRVYNDDNFKFIGEYDNIEDARKAEAASKS